LASCLAQKDLDSVSYELVVVDNCPDQSASDIVRDIPSVKYVHEPRSGTACARNRGVKAANAPLVAFIDDDEVAEPQWAARLLEAQKKFDADVVFGPVIARLEEGSTADTALVEKLFTIDWNRSTGSYLGSGHSGNVLLRKERCFGDGRRFNEQLGLTGGDDSLFFLQLARENVSMAWCREAVVYEIVPRSRTTYAYIFKRCIVRGQSVPRNRWLLDPPEVGAVAWFMMAGMFQFLFFGLTAVITAPISMRQAVKAASRAFLGLGKAFWMPPFRIIFYGP
jgi:glycosyltransferase involved in cell wall biosynthesis